jgi:hypothetical protein
MKHASSILSAFFYITATASIASGFPLKDPCLQTCSNDEITSTILQTCIDQCMMMGHCSGNRLNGECPASSNRRLSCANGCEIAFYTSTVDECKAGCDDGNTQKSCDYKHPNINNPFSMCAQCKEECDESFEISGLTRACGSTPAMRLSCDHGCEIPYRKLSFHECRAGCDNRRTGQTCAYKYPDVDNPFPICGECGDGIDQSPRISACSDGCDIAASNPMFYKYVEVPEATCNHTNKPRFLFAGQSNMVRKGKVTFHPLEKEGNHFSRKLVSFYYILLQYNLVFEDVLFGM